MCTEVVKAVSYDALACAGFVLGWPEQQRRDVRMSVHMVVKEGALMTNKAIYKQVYGAGIGRC